MRKKSPNILHLFSDQQRVDSIGALSPHHFLQTPHLDRLCREGTVFSSAYTPAAECVPARSCLITGRYADRARCGSNLDPMPPESTPTLMSHLREAGYRTHGIGKCHFTPNPQASRGFETRETMEEIVPDPSKDDYLRFLAANDYGDVIEPHGVRGEMYYVPQPSALPHHLHPTQWVGDRCLGFLQANQRQPEPWYLYAGFIHPHPPFSPPSPWHKLYRAPEMPLPYLPKNSDELVCFINRFQNRYKYRDRGLDLNLIRCIRAYYYACVSFIDYQVGRILEALEQAGELDNTLIVYSADHGELLGDFGCFGKRSFHDASQRIPLIARLPKHFPMGETCRAPASLVDLLPTFLTAAGVSPPTETDGIDLAMLAKGYDRGEPVYFHYASGDDAIFGGVDDTWKYAWSVPDNQGFLFPTIERPEIRNRINDPSVAEAKRGLEEQVRKRAAKYAWSQHALDDSGEWKQGEPRTMPEDPDAYLLYQDPSWPELRLPSPYKLDYPRKNVLGL